MMNPMISRLEAALAFAILVVGACLLAGWDEALPVALVPVVLLGVAFLGRILLRRGRGQPWNQAWGREDAP